MSKLGTHYQVGENEPPMYKVDDYHSYNRSYLKPFVSKKRPIGNSNYEKRSTDLNKKYYQKYKSQGYYQDYYKNNKERYMEYQKYWVRTDKGIETRNKINKLNPQRYQWSEDRMIDQIEEIGDYCSNTIQLSHYSNDPIDLDHFSIETY